MVFVCNKLYTADTIILYTQRGLLSTHVDVVYYTVVHMGYLVVSTFFCEKLAYLLASSSYLLLLLLELLFLTTTTAFYNTLSFTTTTN